MNILVCVTVKNLIETLFGSNCNFIIMLCQYVDDSDLSSTFSQIANAVPCLVFPPRHSKVELPRCVGSRRWNMQETSLRAHELSGASLLIDVSSRLLCSWVEPVRDICACCKDNRVAFWSRSVLVDQQS